MMIVNLTPHAITVRTPAGQDLVFPPSGLIARVGTSTKQVGSIDDIPVLRQVFGEVSGIPEPAEGVTYLASTLVAQRAKRADVVSPDTGPTAIRVNGQVVAVRGFQTF